jgi:excisionase family DNA binding protein
MIPAVTLPSQNIGQDDFICTTCAAKILGLSRRRVNMLLEEGRIPFGDYYRVCETGHYKIRRSAVLKLKAN